jgi:hypothetical protein
MDFLMLACALFCLGFACFHMLFWKLFDWPNELQKVGVPTRAIVQILNLRLIFIFLAVGVICLAYPLEMRTTVIGRAVLIGMSCFWAGRFVEQFIFLRYNRVSIHVLSALFLVGAVLFLLPVLL